MQSQAPNDTSHTAPHKALIIMAHGSRRAAANEEFFQLVAQVANTTSNYQLVRPALLEQAPPSLLQACRELPESVTEIDVYPLFFNQGRHVEKDIPAQVAEVLDAFPGRQVRLLDYFGSSSGLAALIGEHLSSQR